MNQEFPELRNDRLLQAAKREEVDKVPVWLMQQAGQYLPEYRELLDKHGYFTICETPELAAEATLQPVNRFNVDAAIIFSDMLAIPKALGMEVEKKDGEEPIISKPLNDPQDAECLRPAGDLHLQLNYVLEAITLTRHKLEGKVPLIGFSGAPFTLMTYMIEGRKSTTLSKSKTWLYNYPLECQSLLSKLTDTVVDFLTEQVRAGAQMIQVFETGTECLSPDLFRNFAFPKLTEVCRRVKRNLRTVGITDIPFSVYTKGTHYNLFEITNDTCYDVVGIDWTIDPLYVRYLASLSTTLQGNMDPYALYAPIKEVTRLTKDMVTKFGPRRYIASLGDNVLPDTNPDHVEAFVDAVHSVKSPW